MANLAFVKFTRLPIEIRLKTWQYADLHQAIFLRTDDKVVAKRPYFQIRAATPPALFAVNRESRNETLKSCKLVHLYTEPRFYLNPDLDMLYFSADVVGTAMLILSMVWQHS